MLPRTAFSPALLFTLFTLAGAFPNLSRAQTIPVQTYSVLPASVPAEAAFKLSLQGGAWDCNTTFSRESVTVSGQRIDLSFLATSTTMPPIQVQGASAATSPIACITLATVTDTATTTPAPAPTLSTPSPTFSIPALKAGKYEVWAAQMAACLYSQQPCEIAVVQKFAGTLEVTLAGAITYSISPATIQAGQDFDLNLLSYQFNCGTTYDMLAASVDGNTLSLTFLDHDNPAAICPAIYKPYGPTYRIGGLKAGTYNVIAYRQPACAPQGCKVAILAATAGTLTVQETSAIRVGWFLKFSTVLASQPFSMQLQNTRFGNCNTTFSHQSVSVSGGGIYTSFLVENHPEHVCIMDVRPHGPTFEMSALPVGRYPLYVTELLACEVSEPLCAVDRMLPVASDTLVVSRTAAILKPGSARSASPIRAWQAKFRTLTGRILKN